MSWVWGKSGGGGGFRRVISTPEGSELFVESGAMHWIDSLHHASFPPTSLAPTPTHLQMLHVHDRALA